MNARLLPIGKLKGAMLAIALLSAALIATGADARGRHHHHHHRGASVGFFFGAPVFYPHYYYPRYYYPPAVLVPAPSSSPVYIEQPSGTAPAVSSPAQASGAYWYFCRDTRTYYPYVQQCASPWEQVVPQSTPPS
jgi:hypothetical protein